MARNDGSVREFSSAPDDVIVSPPNYFCVPCVASNEYGKGGVTRHRGATLASDSTCANDNTVSCTSATLTIVQKGLGVFKLLHLCLRSSTWVPGNWTWLIPHSQALSYHMGPDLMLKYHLNQLNDTRPFANKYWINLLHLLLARRSFNFLCINHSTFFSSLESLFSISVQLHSFEIML